MSNFARPNASRQPPRPPTEDALRAALIRVLYFAASAGDTLTEPEAIDAITSIARAALTAEILAVDPEAIAPAVQRVRWLAARPSNALCDHPACHNHAADPCAEYRRAATRGKGRP